VSDAPDSPASRTAFLRERIEVAVGGPTAPVPFRQGQIDQVQIQVPIDFPLYRLQSGRTHRAQTRYIEENDVADDFFSDPESEEVQAVQHALLLEMIDEAGLREDLSMREQRTPIILTADGFIVDGNRRTAALRDRGDVENLTAVVLPEDADANDYYQTELELQMAAQTKADYNWIDEAVHVRMGHDDLGEDIAAIARRMNRKESDIETILRELDLVDLYLDWLGEPAMYHRVPVSGRDAGEQAFTELELRERRPRFDGLTIDQQRAVRNACFVAIHERQGYEVVRAVFDNLVERPQEVIDRLKPELPENLGNLLEEPEPIDGTTETSDDLLGELAEAEGDYSAPGSVLLRVVGSPDHSEDVAPAIKQVLDDLAELDSEQREQTAALRKVQRARRSLEGVELNDDTPDLAAISQELAAVIECAEALAAQIETQLSER
jgi:hypothetical protein